MRSSGNARQLQSSKSPPSASAATISARRMPRRRGGARRGRTARSISASRCSTPPMSTATGTSESFLGRDARHPPQGRRARHQVRPADEQPDPAARRGDYVLQAVEASLKRLRTDWIDLYQVHFPDPNTPIEETLRALDDLVRQGKVRAIGCSNFSASAGRRGAGGCGARTGLPPSSPARTNTACWCATSRTTSLPVDAAARHELLPYAPLAERLPHRQIPPRQAAARRTRGSPTAATMPTDVINDRNWSLVEKLRDVRRTIRPQHARARLRLAAGQARHRRA